MTAAELLEDGVFTVEQAGEFSGWSRATLYSLMETGELPYSRVRRTRRIPKRALIDLLARNLVGRTGVANGDEPIT